MLCLLIEEFAQPAYPGLSAITKNHFKKVILRTKVPRIRYIVQPILNPQLAKISWYGRAHTTWVIARVRDLVVSGQRPPPDNT